MMETFFLFIVEGLSNIHQSFERAEKRVREIRIACLECGGDHELEEELLKSIFSSSTSSRALLAFCFSFAVEVKGTKLYSFDLHGTMKLLLGIGRNPQSLFCFYSIAGKEIKSSNRHE